MDFARTKYGTVDACGERLPTNYGPQTVSNFATSGSYATEKECQSTNGKVEPTSENKRNSELGQMSFVNHVLDNSSTATERTMNECPKFACVHCGTAQVNQEALEEHFKTCTANNNNTTETHTDPTEDNSSQDAGLKQGHMCMECGEVLSNSYSLKRHSLIHSGDRPHKCEYCDKRYPHAYLLMHHLNTHAGDRPYRCTECGKDFTSPKTLRRHRGVHRKQTYQCYLCDQQFQRIDFLDRHLAKEHDVSKQHLCLVCGKSFTFENMLQEHIESHNRTTEISEKDLKCNLCDNTFSRMSSLNRHKKQMHNCDTEDKSVYFQSPQFKAESDKERDEKENKKTPKKDAPVVCKLCGKSFSRADSLKRHTIGVHENSKNSNEPYEPMLTFPESRSVVQNQHKERNHPCEQCGMQFTTDELLLRHKAVVHPSDNKMEAELLLSLLDRISKEKDNTVKSTAEGTTVSGGGNCSQQSVEYERANIYCTGCKTNFPDANSLEIHMSACMPQSKSEGQMGQTEVAANPAHAAVPRKEGTTQRRASPGGRSGRGRVRCQECGKQFADNYCLKRHMISHTGEKKHTCDICGKKFAHSFHLTTHKKIHLGKRDFRCEICGKTFTVNHALQRHLLTHPSTVVHACIYCDRKFANEASMQKHQLTHIK